MKSFLIVLYLIHIYLCQTLSEDIDDWEESDQIRMRAKASRKYSHTIEELELTKEMPIIDPKPCNDVHPISVFIHSAGRSSGKYYDKRQADRNTWVKEMKDFNITVYFATALNLNQTINDELKKESDKYQDMIQFPFIDDYHNLTLKVISIVRWVNRKCLNSTHILKTGDDVIVNTPYLLDNLSQLKRGFTGHLLSESKVERDPSSQSYMPQKYYGNDTYPDFESGPFYIMGQNITPSLLNSIDSYSSYVLDLEDVFLTGLVAHEYGFPRYDEPKIKLVGCADVCLLFDAFVVYQCENANQTQEFWSKWKNTSYEQCFLTITTSKQTTTKQTTFDKNPIPALNPTSESKGSTTTTRATLTTIMVSLLVLLLSFVYCL